MNTHQHYLKCALALATKRRGFCAPNPAVGAVIVNDGNIIGKGNHFGPGFPHAEINAINQAGNNTKDASLYVTLEPCCHTGRTPPCTERIIKSSFANVYFGLHDPNPLVAGKGQALLNQAGISCKQIELSEINEFYRSYLHWTLHKKPWVKIKIAVSQNKKIANANGAPVKITGIEAQRLTHQLRAQSDAILTTINTVINDDPKLNVRLGNKTIAKPIFVLDPQCRLPNDARINKTAKTITLFHSSKPTCSSPWHTIEIETHNKMMDLNQVIEKIGENGIHDLWVEVGAKTFDLFVKYNIADEVYLYESPSFLDATALSFFTTIEEILKNYKQLDQKFLGNDLVRHFIKTSI